MTFLKDVLLQVRIGREINSREWYITEQASGCPFVKAKNAELTDDMDCTFRHSTFCLGSLTLYLQTNFAIRRVGEIFRDFGIEALLHNFQWVRKDLSVPLVHLTGTIRDRRRRTTCEPPAMPPAAISHISLMRPVSGSVARARTKSFTVNLIAFSGATP